MLTLQPFDYTDKAYATIVDIWNRVWPDQFTTVAQLQTYDAGRDPDNFFERWLVNEQNGVTLGFGFTFALWWSAVSDQYVIDFATVPERRGEGAATLFYNHILATLINRSYATLVAQTREDVTAGISFLEQRGFQCKLHKVESQLSLKTFDRNILAAGMAKMAQQGIAIVPLPQLQQQDTEWLHNLWELDWDIIQDVPSFTQHVRLPIAEFAERFARSDFLPHGFVVAIDTNTNTYVGLSQVYCPPHATDQLETGLTGVRRPYRRRGIALAMKLAIINFALRTQVTSIRTRNAAGNPMVDLNQKLGFQPLPTWLTYEKIAG